MDARDRFVTALAEAVSTAYYTHGDIFLSIEEIGALADEQQVPEAEARATLRLLDEEGLLEHLGGRSYGRGIGLLVRYEEVDRRLSWQRNVLRREILRLAAIAYDEDTGGLTYEEGKEQFVDAPWAEAYAASLTLDYLLLVDVQPFMGPQLRRAHHRVRVRASARRAAPECRSANQCGRGRGGWP